MRRANTAKDKPETTMTRFFIAGIAALLLATGTLQLAQATERYSVRCKGQLFTVYGHHGYMFFRGEPENNDGKALPDRWFRFGDDDARTGHQELYFRGRKCKYVRDLLNVEPADSKRSIRELQ
jgi:hypothetical protein